MRSVLRGGVVGGLPGFLVASVPVLLSELGFITSDQSQIGFIGVPLLFIGVFAGTVLAAAGTGYAGKVVLGVFVGFATGIGGAVLIDAALDAAGSTVAGIWLFLTPVAMIAGGALAARWGEHGPTSRPTALQH